MCDSVTNMSSPPPPQTIRIGDLDITQLADVKKQLDDVSMFFFFFGFSHIPAHPGTRPSRLFLLSAQAGSGQVQSLHPQHHPDQAPEQPCALGILLLGPFLTWPPDNTILVPLTNSLYVPGNLSDPDHVVVDVGTGYFVKKVSLYISLSWVPVSPSPSRHVLRQSNTTTKRSTTSNRISIPLKT